MNTQYKISAIVGAMIASTITAGVYAKGGTAKPPTKGAVAPFVVATPPTPTPTTAWTNIHQFDVTGFIEDATVNPASASCPSGNEGGTIKVNGIMITVPCNSIVQLPANTLNWPDVIAPAPTTNALGNTSQPLTLTLAGLSALNAAGPTGTTTTTGATAGSTGPVAAAPPFEAQVIGNIVNGQYIAGLIYLSQQSLNIGSGVITRIDYNTGDIWVSSNVSGDLVRLQINDPFGRFGRAQSPDPRLSVDDQNPTIHAASGYPMCVPRVAPGAFVKPDGTLGDDPLCPEKNRPLASGGCRNFGVAGVTPPVSGELAPPAAGQQYCSQFVMRAPPGTPASALFVPITKAQNSISYNIADPSNPFEPDVLQQAPFEVGDYIDYQGTLIGDALGGYYISAHTIEANVAIYTQPFTQPSYLAIGEFGVGTADPALTAVNGAPQETQDRIFLEAETTDVKTPVDIFMMDVDPVTGLVSNRWTTPYEMTGECNPATTLAATCYGSSGGITTQNAGPNPTRARIRATKAISGILSGPSRNIRVMARSLCQLLGTPLGGNPPRTYDQAALDACINNAPLVANGLKAGQYFAPTFEYIFPENATPGQPLVPNDLWHLPFLQFGEGPGVGPLSPTPW